MKTQQNTITNNEAFEIGYTKKDANYFIEKGLHKAITYKVLSNLAYLKNNQACYDLLHGKKGIIDIDDLFQECALAICEYTPYYDDNGTLIIDKQVFASITNTIYKQATRNLKHIYLETPYGDIDLYNSTLLSISDGFNEFIQTEDVKNLVNTMKQDTILTYTDKRVLDLRLQGFKLSTIEKTLSLSRAKVRTAMLHISKAYNNALSNQ
jgi:hypothetical protein